MSDTKECNKCHQIKIIATDFYFRDKNKKYMMKICKECYLFEVREKRKKPEIKAKLKISNAKYHAGHKEENKIRNKTYQETHKEEIKTQNKIYAETHKEESQEYQKEYYQEHKEKINNYKADYRVKNKEDINRKQREYEKENRIELNKKRNERNKRKRATDFSFQLKSNVSSSVGYYLKQNNSSKGGKSSRDYLPFTIDELRAHLESLFDHPDSLVPNTKEVWMTKDNYGKYEKDKWDDNDPSTWKWQLDHKTPHSTFKYTSMEEQSFKNCWDLSNLRPYSAKQNWLDGVNRTRHPKKK